MELFKVPWRAVVEEGGDESESINEIHEIHPGQKERPEYLW